MQKREEGWWLVIGDPKSNRYSIILHFLLERCEILLLYHIPRAQPIINQEVDPSDKIKNEARLHGAIFAGDSQVHPVLHV
jgi:hypothetical protein